MPLSRSSCLFDLYPPAPFFYGGYCSLLTCLPLACLRSALSDEDEEGLLAAGFPVTSQDLDAALAELQEAHSDAVGAPKVSPRPADRRTCVVTFPRNACLVLGSLQLLCSFWPDY